MSIKFIIGLSLACLLSFPGLSLAADKADQQVMAKRLVQSLKQKAFCGVYRGKSGFFDGFLFHNGNTVITETFGQKSARPYLIQNETLFILGETTVYRFKIQKKNRLEGLDRWTKGQKYALKKKSKVGCQALEADEDGLALMDGLVCYLKANDLEVKDDLKSASSAYLKCCQGGNAHSCDRYGVFQRENKKLVQAKKYFKKSCDMGYGGACKNLGHMERVAGDKDMAKKYFMDACRKLERSACIEPPIKP